MVTEVAVSFALDHANKTTTVVVISLYLEEAMLTRCKMRQWLRAQDPISRAVTILQTG